MKLIDRKLNWMLGIIIFCFIICFVAIVFYKPYKKGDSAELNKALEEQRKVTHEQIRAREEMINQAQQMVIYLKERDSLLNVSLNKNEDELEKIRKNAKTTDYSHYNSDELQRAVAEAARQYRAFEPGH